MNYYPFNVGDYAAHTAHLEPMEDLAYRRLLDQYYLREGPLPADIQATAKLVRMRSMAADVESVLREFFTLTDEGWRHSRCDAEVEKMQDKQAKARASAAVSVNVRQAKQRAFAERTLAALEADAKRAYEEVSADVELPTPTPTPTLNTARAVFAGETDESRPSPTAAGAICLAMKRAGLSAVNPGDPRLLALLEQGATESEFVGLAQEAVEKSKGFAWVLVVLEARRREAADISLAPPPTDPGAWRHDDRSLRAMAAQLGVASRPDERIDGWQRRIVTAWQRAGQPALQRQEQTA